jgi:16S rRNA (cytidine1402-2'-O)-methyltransferase
MIKADQRGILYLIPTPLGSDGMYTLPEHVCELLPTIRHFFVESEKEARRFLVRLFKDRGEIEALDRVGQINLYPIGQLDRSNSLRNTFAPIFSGRDMGLLSDTGSPAIADPGAEIVRWAHSAGVVVKPLVGPTSIVMALMASGLGGQRFSFNGYLPRDAAERRKQIKYFEQRAIQDKQTQLFIETPYRNDALFEDLISTLSASVLLCLALDLTLLTEEILVQPVEYWRKTPKPLMHKRPCIFAFASFPH